MKTNEKTMPKSINSKKNNKSNIKFLKESNGQVFVSEEQYKKHPELFLGTPGHNLRLKDGREAIVSIVVRGMVFPLERLALLLFSSIIAFNDVMDWENDIPHSFEAILHCARTRKIFTSIKEYAQPRLFPGQFDKMLFHLYAETDVEEQDLVEDSRLFFDNPENLQLQVGDEGIDVQYLAYLIEIGYKPLKAGLDVEFDSVENYADFSFTLMMGLAMVAQLRGMGKEEAVGFAVKEFGPECEEFYKVVSRILTINKEA